MGCNPTTFLGEDSMTGIKQDLDNYRKKKKQLEDITDSLCKKYGIRNQMQLEAELYGLWKFP